MFTSEIYKNIQPVANKQSEIYDCSQAKYINEF